MKIQYFGAEPWEKDYVQERLPHDEIVFHDALPQEPGLHDEAAEVLSVFIDSPVGEGELGRFPSLKYIATRSTGFDHIDLEACKARGITVANVPSYGENTVAEFAFGLILALARRVIDADERVRETGTFTQTGLRGFDLFGKTLGVVGCGHIGIHAVRMGNGFNMRVLGFDTRRDEAFAAENNFTYTELDELLAASDIVTLHVPYNVHTHHLINRDRFAKMKRGSYLVNTSRGAVVETDALIEALRDGIVAGAGLDVLEEEGDLADPLALLAGAHPNEENIKTALANHYLIDHPRVIVTPHTAFNTDEAVRRIADVTIDNLRAFSSGAPINTVPPHP